MNEPLMTAKPELARGELVRVFVLAMAGVALGATIFYAYDWYTMDRFTMSITDFSVPWRECSRVDCESVLKRSIFMSFGGGGTSS